MWKTLRDGFPKDKDLPARVARLQALQKVLDGSLYDGLKYAAHTEYNDAGEYIPLRERRPSVRYNMCKLAVGEAVAMLFSEGHFPEIEYPDEGTKNSLRDICQDIALNATMVDFATKGAIGSAALRLRVLQGRLYVDALSTIFLTPTWNPERPDELVRVVERYKTTGAELKDAGYDIAADHLEEKFWFEREWNADEEMWIQPVLVNDPSRDGSKPLPRIRDAKRSVRHSLGLVPMVWVKNLPGGDAIDGCPSFSNEAIETQIEHEYQLTQAGRALRYAGDPLLLVKDPSGDVAKNGELIRTAANAMIVGKDGDAKLVEISGGATDAVLAFCQRLRDLTLEQLHASRINPDKLSIGQSGRALEILNQPLLWLADQLRVSYGIGGLQRLLDMIVEIGTKTQLVSREGNAYPAMVKDKKVGVTLKWPEWYPPDPEDLQTEAMTLKTHTDAGHMSQETAVGIVARQYDVPDAAAELTKIKADQAAKLENAQVNETINA